MTIYDLMYLFIDADMQDICIYDNNINEVVYEGLYEDMPEEYDDMEICSIDNLYGTDTLTVNIDGEV